MRLHQLVHMSENLETSAGNLTNQRNCRDGSGGCVKLRHRSGLQVASVVSGRHAQSMVILPGSFSGYDHRSKARWTGGLTNYVQHTWGIRAGLRALECDVQGICQLIIRSFPVGEYNLRLGITKELHPEMIATHQGAHCC